jgi:hypothetical protein
VIGTSLKVSPFNTLIDMVDDYVPRLLINNKLVGPFVDTWEDKVNCYRDVVA